MNGYGKNVDSLDLRLRVSIKGKKNFLTASPQPFAIPSSKRLQNRDVTSKYCKLNSEYFTLRI